MVPSCELRRRFAAQLSRMYRREVPKYGQLLEILDDANRDSAQVDALMPGAGLLEPSHGAIRVGSARELAGLRRLFALYGLFPVDYYDLVPAGIPVHSTAFRPIGDESLAHSPLRLFCSLLRSDLIEDGELRADVHALLATREILPAQLQDYIERAEQTGGISETDAEPFVNLTCEVFRWKGEAITDIATYERLRAAHPLLADVAAFPGPHLNHLTPRSLDIDLLQQRMAAAGLDHKAYVEGPPRRAVPILLRQTSFNALSEPVRFPASDDRAKTGTHRARFGEVEQRGIALTPRGRKLYDECLHRSKTASGSSHGERLDVAFAAFPDGVSALLADNLAYFRFSLRHGTREQELRGVDLHDPETRAACVDSGMIDATPILYEDFLPVSAAGIFRSNLGDTDSEGTPPQSSRAEFEATLGTPVINSDDLYARQQLDSILALEDALAQASA